jgi:hypothetical protein
MQNDYYVLAHEQASRERADIRSEIDKLLARDTKLEKLVECLNDFLPESPAPEVHGRPGQRLARTPRLTFQILLPGLGINTLRFR